LEHTEPITRESAFPAGGRPPPACGNPGRNGQNLQRLGEGRSRLGVLVEERSKAHQEFVESCGRAELFVYPAKERGKPGRKNPSRFLARNRELPKLLVCRARQVV